MFEETKFPELSKAVKYFKETEGGFGVMCKTVVDYAKNYAKDYAEEREEIVRVKRKGRMLRNVKKQHAKRKGRMQFAKCWEVDYPEK